jgi:hypothetical protein
VGRPIPRIRPQSAWIARTGADVVDHPDRQLELGGQVDPLLGIRRDDGAEVILAAAREGDITREQAELDAQRKALAPLTAILHG